jgi:hypothetical protein
MTWLAKLWRIVTGRYRIAYVDDLPSKLKQRCVYVVGEAGYHWYAAFRCPDQCGELIHLSLLLDDRPRWTITQHSDGSCSMHPSILRTRGCKCHFVLRRGRVIWCKPTTRPVSSGPLPKGELE